MTGYVYAIRAPVICLVKVGWSENPVKRFGQIKTSSPIEVSLVGFTEAGRDQELEAHKLLREYRVRGEWFHDIGLVAEFVRMLAPYLPVAVDGTLARAEGLRRYVRESQQRGFMGFGKRAPPPGFVVRAAHAAVAE